MFRMSSRGRTGVTVLLLDLASPLFVIGWWGGVDSGHPATLFLAYPWLFLTALAFPLALAVAELYSPRSSWWSPSAALRVAAAALAVVALFGVALAVAGTRRDLPELLGALAVGMTTVAFGGRAVVGIGLRSGHPARRALVVGAGWAGGQVVDCTLFEPRLRVRIVGLVDDDPLKRNNVYKGVPVVGTGADLAEAVTRHGADLVVVAIQGALRADVAANLVRLSLAGVEVMDMPGFVERVTGQLPIRQAEGEWTAYGGGFDTLRHRWRSRLKRLFDVSAASAALLLAAPLLAIIAVVVRLDTRASVFFPVERAGRGEKPLRLLKFRTMREAGGEAGRPFRRLTGFGRLLRRTRLDEMPQLLNVLKGDLSFVGPRPERPAVASRLGQLIPFYPARFSLTPGLTGWAQVQQRPGTAPDEPLERLKYDLYYVKNLSLRLDLFVLLKSVKLVVFPTGR